MKFSEVYEFPKFTENFTQCFTNYLHALHFTSLYSSRQQSVVSTNNTIHIPV